jgi:hypothetical protein
MPTKPAPTNFTCKIFQHDVNGCVCPPASSGVSVSAPPSSSSRPVCPSDYREAQAQGWEFHRNGSGSDPGFSALIRDGVLYAEIHHNGADGPHQPFEVRVDTFAPLLKATPAGEPAVSISHSGSYTTTPVAAMQDGPVKIAVWDADFTYNNPKYGKDATQRLIHFAIPCDPEFADSDGDFEAPNNTVEMTFRLDEIVNEGTPSHGYRGGITGDHARWVAETLSGNARG